MNKSMTKCPVCNGKGRVQALNIIGNINDMWIEDQEGMIMCPKCNGTGRVKDD